MARTFIETPSSSISADYYFSFPPPQQPQQADFVSAPAADFSAARVSLLFVSCSVLVFVLSIVFPLKPVFERTINYMISPVLEYRVKLFFKLFQWQHAPSIFPVCLVICGTTASGESCTIGSPAASHSSNPPS